MTQNAAKHRVRMRVLGGSEGCCMSDEEKNTSRETTSQKGSAGKQPVFSALDTVAKIIAAAPRSEKEVRDRLYKKGFRKAEIEDAIKRAKEYGYIDDARYVADFVEYYSGKLGRKKLEYKLIAEKGISREIVAAGIADALSEEDEREKAVAVAFKCAAAKRVTEKKDLQKVGAFLWQRGFPRDVIDAALDAVAETLGGNEDF